VLGDYRQVTLIAGDTGHLTFGRSQTKLGSGNLNELMQRYCAKSGARFGTSQQLIKEYKPTHGLVVTGVADVALIAQLVA